MIKIFGRLILLSNGFWYIKVHKKNISDYLPEYKEPVFKNNLGERAPITISNHNSLMDIFANAYLTADKFTPAFLTSSHILNYPVLGTLNKNIQSIFVDRGDKNSKDKAL